MDSKQKQEVINNSAIVCGAPIENNEWFLEEIYKHDFIIAADSGYDHLKNVDVVPNVLIGDMDSISTVPQNIELHKFPTKKDKTDFAICLDFCLENGISQVDVYGAWGRRADHSICAVLTMLQYAKKGLEIRMLTETSEMFILFDKCNIPHNDGYVSVFPLEASAEGVTLKNFEYPLDNCDLDCCSPLGVSNSIPGEDGEISLKNGSLLVIIQK